MEIQNITKQQAIDGIKGLFDMTTWEDKQEGKSFYIQKDGTDDAEFFFDKRQYERYKVIEKLSKYFEDKNIIDGQCRIDGMTLVWTQVSIEPRTTNKG